MKKDNFLKDYYDSYIKNLNPSDKLFSKFYLMKQILLDVKQKNNKVMFAGNGASASIASHAALDFTKQAKIPSICFNEAAFITAFANDFGYENWVYKAIEFHGSPGDVAVLISSSGKSLNIVNAAKYCNDSQIKVVTFSGFEEDNPLSEYGELNFWVDSKAYNIIENIHQIWLMSVCDLIIGKSEYSVS